MPSMMRVPPEAQPSDHFDAVAATNAYLAQIPADAHRDLTPTSKGEWMFFDHPSGRDHIYAAMRWKAENLKLFTPPPGH